MNTVLESCLCFAILVCTMPFQGSRKHPSGHPGQVDFPFRQVTFSPSLPDVQGPRQAVRRLIFDNDHNLVPRVLPRNEVAPIKYSRVENENAVVIS